MDKEEIIEALKAYPLKTKREIRDLLTDAIADEEKVSRRSEEERAYAKALLAMEAAIQRSIDPDRHSPGDSWARKCIAHLLYHDGWPQTAIARMQKRNHATISHSCKTVDDALSLPQAYPDIVEMYTKFKTIYRTA